MSVLVLKVIACVAMLIDHIGYTFDIFYLRIIGRISFPIFLYLIYNGYYHTSNKLHYALRLAVFALLSQVPFSLFCYNQIWTVNGNVFVTLLVSLLCLWSAIFLKKLPVLRLAYWLPSLVVYLLYFFDIIQSDYGALGTILIMLCYIFDIKITPTTKIAWTSGVRYKLLQYSFYAFYPLHMLLLWFIKYKLS